MMRHMMKAPDLRNVISQESDSCSKLDPITYPERREEKQLKSREAHNGCVIFKTRVNKVLHNYTEKDFDYFGRICSPTVIKQEFNIALYFLHDNNNSQCTIP